MQTVVLGNEKWDFLHCLLYNFKSNTTYMTLEWSTTLMKFEITTINGIIDLQFDETSCPASIFYPPLQQPDCMLENTPGWDCGTLAWGGVRWKGDLVVELLNHRGQVR